MALKVNVKNGKAYIYTPYNTLFIQKVKQFGARWYKVDGCWVVSEMMMPNVRELLWEIFGSDGSVSGKTANVELSFGEQYEGPLASSVVFLGREIVLNSKGLLNTGEDVVISQGGYEIITRDDGWRILVEKGSIFKVIGIPELVIRRAKLPDCVTMKILEEVLDRDALIKERETLVKRIAEIDELLKEEQP